MLLRDPTSGLLGMPLKFQMLTRKHQGPLHFREQGTRFFRRAGVNVAFKYREDPLLPRNPLLTVPDMPFRLL